MPICLTVCMSMAVALAGEPDVRKTTHTYKTVGAVKIQADVYRSASKETRPVLVWIHGGALIVGSRQSVPRNLLDLAKKEDYVLVSIDYRLAPEVKLPAIADDVVDALRWIRKEGSKLFRGDPDRLVISGGSAGGYLTLLAGTRVEPRPRGLVAYWGYGDVDGDWYTKPSEWYRTKTPLVPREEALKAISSTVLTETPPGAPEGKARGQLYRYFRQNGLWTKEVTGFDPATERSKLDVYCPVRVIPADYPPTLMIHGTNDDDVPYEQSAALARALAAKRLPHELVTVAGAGHGLAGGDPKRVGAAHAKALDFIRAHLK
ncbi:MAG: alpha/beta hydrolase [Gemmataceae bacterium]|nr:alpha/beta hydrolase [Gemmataceae bacterium]